MFMYIKNQKGDKQELEGEEKDRPTRGEWEQIKGYRGITIVMKPIILNHN